MKLSIDNPGLEPVEAVKVLQRAAPGINIKYIRKEVKNKLTVKFFDCDLSESQIYEILRKYVEGVLEDSPAPVVNHTGGLIVSDITHTGGKAIELRPEKPEKKEPEKPEKKEPEKQKPEKPKKPEIKEKKEMAKEPKNLEENGEEPLGKFESGMLSMVSAMKSYVKKAEKIGKDAVLKAQEIANKAIEQAEKKAEEMERKLAEIAENAEKQQKQAAEENFKKIQDSLEEVKKLKEETAKAVTTALAPVIERVQKIESKLDKAGEALK